MSSQSSNRRALVTLLILVFLVWVLGGLVALSRVEPGEFGDMFGAVNALFSGLAFAAIVFTIRQQKEELELQRNELVLTRKEFAEGNRTSKQQTFENTFFQLLRMHYDIVGSMRISRGSTTLVGRECFSDLDNDLWSHYSECVPAPAKVGEQGKYINDAYMNFFRDNQHLLGHYFRSLYNVIKFVNRSSTEDKRLYTNLVRAQLSSTELKLLFYNCLSDLGREKFKPLVEEFSLLKSLPKESIYPKETRNEQLALYAPSAYS